MSSNGGNNKKNIDTCDEFSIQYIHKHCKTWVHCFSFPFNSPMISDVVASELAISELTQKRLLLILAQVTPTIKKCISLKPGFIKFQSVLNIKKCPLPFFLFQILAEN